MNSDAVSDVSSDVESYQQSVSSVGSSYANTFYPNSIRGSFFGGLDVEMNEIGTDDEWVGVGRYAARRGGELPRSQQCADLRHLAYNILSLIWQHLNAKPTTRCSTVCATA